MSEHKATIIWTRTTPDFTYKTYTRDHLWRFDNGVEIAGSAAPAFLGNPDRVDPEGAFVAALSSCHMLTFLALAAKTQLKVLAYEDRVSVELDTLDKVTRVTRIVLSPTITVAAGTDHDKVDRFALRKT